MVVFDYCNILVLLNRYISVLFSVPVRVIFSVFFVFDVQAPC